MIVLSNHQEQHNQGTVVNEEGSVTGVIRESSFINNEFLKKIIL